MSSPIANLPAAKRFVLANATLPQICVDGVEAPSCEGLISADIVVADGKVEAILKPGSAPAGLPSTDLRHGMVWPTFVDMHTHLDKGHIWDRKPNPTGDFIGALEAVQADRVARWSAEDVKARMEFSLRTAYAHG
ncbi:MAG: cytosine deaminase, partial [Allorhizobium sp.]